jgi:hypothetical protein
MSNLPSDTPKLPKWIFLVSDAVLMAAAWFIATHNPGPLGLWPLLAVVGLLVFGVVIAVVPYLTDYARKQDEALDERQRGLETLSRTTATSAEQISIAANGLHELLELSHRNLKHAEQLPHKLQEKIAEFQQLLATANDEEKEELERELTTLRSSDSERLEATADKVHKAAADWAKLEATAAKHLSATSEALAKLAGTAEAGAGKLTQAAEAAAVKASAEIAKALATAQAGSTSALNDKQAAALAEIDAQLAKGAGRLTVRATEAAGLFDTKLAALEAAIARLESVAAKAGTGVIAPTAQSSVLEQSSSDTGVPPVISPEPAAASEPAPATPVEASPPKRVRKPRREEPAAEVAAVETVAADSTKPDTAAEATPATPPVAQAMPSPEPVAATPTPAEAAPPPAPGSIAAPVSAPEATPATVASDDSPSAIANPQSEEPKSARKRTAKKPVEPEPPAPEIAAEEPAAPPASNEFSQEPPEEARATSAVSADGATRLLVTAYVGIGNRLFVRGDGPGLSQDKGVPLQFVSIGKWRWETADATAPIRVKLYKNDQNECSALGEITLAPGHQAEVTANF